MDTSTSIMTAREKELQNRIDELEKLANFDLLTNLPTKILFHTLLKKSISNASRNNYLVAVIILDLDNFKNINNNYGRKIGDEILLEVSNRLLCRVREGDMVARVGGDRFAIILEHIQDDSVLAQITNTILKTISSTLTLSNMLDVSINASAGIAIAPKDSKDDLEIFNFAETSLALAKKDGSGLYRFYTQDMTSKALQKAAYRDAISNALDNNDFQLYYQPQIDMQTDKIIGAEVLLRWKSKINENIPPSLFIPLAEETGLIHKIGELVLTRACEQGALWSNEGYNINISINISPIQVQYQNLTKLINEALNKTNFNPQRLELEITEDSLLQKNESLEMLQNLRKEGVKISIDNFGTGFSSLAYLKYFPVDILKIDKIFIDNITDKKEDSSLVGAIINMGKAFDFKVLGIGVETKEQRTLLKDKGCDLYQGYIKSQAISAVAFERLLKEQNS